MGAVPFPDADTCLSGGFLAHNQAKYLAHVPKRGAGGALSFCDGWRKGVVLGILGGGVSGLSLAYLYTGRCEILEREMRVGGHCRTHEKDGFRYDEGGHILFSRNEVILNQILEVLGGNVDRRRRNNKIWYKGRFVKYPFENGLGVLDKEDIFDCLYHYINNDYPEPANFRDWIYYTFGKGIAERYLIPYNQKVWKTDPELMGVEWVGRVPRPPLEDIIRSALNIETEGYVHQLYFYYPRDGGIEGLPYSLAQEVANRCRVLTGFAVTTVRKDRLGWIVSDGREDRRYDSLVSTIPLPELVRICPDVPLEVADACRRLRYNPSVFVLVGLGECLARDITAVYFPQPDIVFNRVCFLHTFSPSLVPEGKYSALAEITCDVEDEVWKSSDELVTRRVVSDLARTGIVRIEDVITTDVRRVKYSYVVNRLDSRRNYEIVRAHFGAQGLELLGRFAEFEYWNIDQCFAEASKLADRLGAALTP
jgi:protoporphyrinogen oxidase